jgi:predicted NAD/FAD-binding protein
MNELQHIPQKQYGDVLVTLNPPFEPNEKAVIGRWKYEHPVLNTEV